MHVRGHPFEERNSYLARDVPKERLDSLGRRDALASRISAQIGDTWSFAEGLGCPHTDLVGVLISLEAEDMLRSSLLQTQYLVVSKEGLGVRRRLAKRRR